MDQKHISTNFDGKPAREAATHTGRSEGDDVLLLCSATSRAAANERPATGGGAGGTDSVGASRRSKQSVSIGSSIKLLLY
jgi:hypothetical protein